MTTGNDNFSVKPKESDAGKMSGGRRERKSDHMCQLLWPGSFVDSGQIMLLHKGINSGSLWQFRI